jgi:hypothetical protein
MFKRILRNPLPVLCLALLWAIATPIALASDVTHGRDCATATAVKLGVDERVILDGAGDRAVYRFGLDNRGLLDIQITSGNSSGLNAELLNSSCNVMRSVSGGVSRVTGKPALITVPGNMWTLDPGLYFVRFSPAAKPAFRSSFTFATVFTPHYGHDCATAEPMGLSMTKSGELLYAEDREVFRVDLAEAGQIHAWVTDDSHQPYLNLHYADCSFAGEVQFVDETTGGIVSATLAPGTYYLSVRPEPNAIGPYDLTLEFSPAPSVDYPSSEVPLD